MRCQVRGLFALLVAAMLCGLPQASGEHPRLLVRADQHEELLARVSEVEWLKSAYKAIGERVDKYADLVEEDPDWLVSRMMMNWETHYILPITRESKWVGGEGRAPVPTPRFAGARDWKTTHRVPHKIEKWKEYNGWGDRIWLVNRESHEGEWVHPSETGRVIESVNRHIMKIAAEAAFMHWMTGEERYAKVALPVLWTYMDGFQHVSAPRVEDPESGSGRIIGTTSFEVIHEDILILVSQCYDFINPYLIEEGKDPMVIQRGIKKMADRVIEGGLNEGNWNLFQAKIIAHGGLVLESDEHYGDGRGRQYYVDTILNADQPGQLGLMRVVEEGYDKETAIWPEAPGYGFETTASILGAANLLALEPGGRALLDHPQLEQAMLVQAELLHPNGLSIGLGDSTNIRINMVALEMLISAARKLGKAEQESRLTAILLNEIETGRYERAKQTTLHAVTSYVGELKDVEPSVREPMRTFMAGPLNALMMHLDGGEPKHDLSAVMFGTAGGHAHANGLAIELYGAGLILGPDPGRGSSYWQRDQRHYYSRMAAHNTVIPNGHALYPPEAPGQLAMKIAAVEPKSSEPGLSHRIGFAQATFKHLRPATDQRRTLGVVRLEADTAFYFDVFRSRVLDGKKERCHDYLYHGLAQDGLLTDASGKPLALEECEMLGELHGDLSGYDFFREEKSVESEDDIRARFALELPDGTVPTMDLWMLGGAERRIFSMEAPQNRAIRENLPDGLDKLRMPTVLVRQNGEAWKRPFVAIYEPYFKKRGPWVESIRRCEASDGLEAMLVTGKDSRVLLMESMDPVEKSTCGGVSFSGTFGVVVEKEGRVDEVYLGNGRVLEFQGLKLEAVGAKPVSASLKRNPDGSWECQSSEPVKWEADESVALPGELGAGS